MEDLAARFEQSTGYAIMGQLTQIILDSDRISDYDRDRVIEGIEMSAEFFYDNFVQVALDKMADELRDGFEKVDGGG